MNFDPRDVFIVAGARTPLGCYNGTLSPLSAVELGKYAVQGALKKSNLSPSDVQEIVFGNVVGAGLGQNPARQVALAAGLPPTVPATTVNKVCASAMKAISIATQLIRLGEADVVVAGGTESMTNCPYLVPRARFGVRYGHAELLDALLLDGLTDFSGKCPMGVAAEKTVAAYNLTREAQDDYAIVSYTRAQKAIQAGYFDQEIVPVEIRLGRNKPPVIVSSDEQVNHFDQEKLRQLRPSFDEKGSITAANASPLSDGAAAVVLVSGEKLHSMIDRGLVSQGASVFRILSTADAEQEPVKFTTSPSIAIPKALEKANVFPDQVDFYEINEAFSCVALVNMKELNLKHEKVNVFGGAVALGHPLGCSGARILITLCSVLKHHKATVHALQ
ncbi:erg10, acetyl-CoA C-acetyltransferase [Coelomomyces lativittatus]|nr:erg10, acetyl-CoA C-acetyltransferase [Coelomomyces lativittatus]